MGHCTVFVCPSVRASSGSAPSHPHPARPSLLKWFLSLLVCCWGSRARQPSGDNESGESIEMGPMTLREYIATLQPYDPEIHGWRGDEPWTLRRQRRRSQQCCANGAASSPGDGPAYSSVSYRPGTRSSPQLRA